MKVKVMVGGGRRSIRAPAKLGPGEMNAGVKEGVDRNAKGRRLEPM